MARLQLQSTISVDGFMAGPGGDMSWLVDHLGPNAAVDDLMGQVGALLVGGRTFRGDDPYKGTVHKGEPYGGGWAGPQIVLTHEAPATPIPDTTFVDDLHRAIDIAKAAAGDRFVAVLGADIGRQCLAVGQLDEIFVSVAPVLLGDGVRLFDWPGGRRVRLEPLGFDAVPHAVNLRYAIRY